MSEGIADVGNLMKVSGFFFKILSNVIVEVIVHSCLMIKIVR